MRVALLMMMLSCGGLSCVSDEGNMPPDTGTHWHGRYIADKCAQCPTCCTGDILEMGVPREDEDLFCTPDVCPGDHCPCVRGPNDLWWINYTGFGTDDED